MRWHEWGIENEGAPLNTGTPSLLCLCFSVCPARSCGHFAVLVLVREAKVFEHLHVLFDGRARCREHVACDGGRRACLERRRAILRQQLAAGCEADVGRRVDEAEERNRAQDVIGWELRTAFHARALDGHQRVDGDGLDAEFLQRDGHVEAVLPCFAHADDAA